VEDPVCVTAGITADGVTLDSVWVGDVVVEPVPVCPSAAPASAACAVASCGVDEPVGLEPTAADAVDGVLEPTATEVGVKAETTLTGFDVDAADVDDAAAVDALCPLGLELPEDAVAAGTPTPIETPLGACARAPRLVGGASSFITILVWTASTTPEALRL
jgi:hypothetical protein